MLNSQLIQRYKTDLNGILKITRGKQFSDCYKSIIFALESVDPNPNEAPTHLFFKSLLPLYFLTHHLQYNSEDDVVKSVDSIFKPLNPVDLRIEVLKLGREVYSVLERITIITSVRVKHKLKFDYNYLLSLDSRFDGVYNMYPVNPVTNEMDSDILIKGLVESLIKKSGMIAHLFNIMTQPNSNKNPQLVHISDSLLTMGTYFALYYQTHFHFLNLSQRSYLEQFFVPYASYMFRTALVRNNFIFQYENAGGSVNFTDRRDEFSGGQWERL